MGEPYPTDRDIRAAMLSRADEFTEITGMSAADIGKKAMNDPAFVYQIRAGRNFNIATYRRFMAWLDKKWPRDHVPRPVNGARTAGKSKRACPHHSKRTPHGRAARR